ncbi:hypothetical protein B0H13DRAFT_2667122 [Mycena leptocephala]|nr:hypothetical protein B0H13DRAFT_2667122 [Mycena leptocephala]
MDDKPHMDTQFPHGSTTDGPRHTSYGSGGMFSGSHHFTLSTGHLTNYENFNNIITTVNGETFIDGHVRHTQRNSEPGLHILRSAAVSDAFHDSVARYPQPKCHPETRMEILDNLWLWSSQTDPEDSVLWLHGPAGAGKSAISQSFCEKLEAEGTLGASFFFELDIPLAALDTGLERNPSLVDRSLSTQLQKLIVEPCRQCDLGRFLTIVIDGLDECAGNDIQQEILRSISNVVREGSRPPLRFFIASRPEPHIREIFMDRLDGIHRSLTVTQSFKDVKRYLQDNFARLAHENRALIATIPGPWPWPTLIDDLVEQSSGYFRYPSSVIKLIDDAE